METTQRNTKREDTMGESGQYMRELRGGQTMSRKASAAPPSRGRKKFHLTSFSQPTIHLGF